MFCGDIDMTFNVYDESQTALVGILAAWRCVVCGLYRLLGSAENLLQHGAYGSTFRAFQKSVFQIIILKTAL